MAVILRGPGRLPNELLTTDTLYMSRYIYQHLGSLVKNKSIVAAYNAGSISLEFRNFLDNMQKLSDGETDVETKALDEYLGALGDGKEYFESIERFVPEDRNISFMNSFQNASKYKFYTGKEAWSYNTVFYRKNQFDLGDYDTIFNNKKVLFRGWWKSTYLDTVRLDNGRFFRFALMDSYTVFTKVKGKINNISDSIKEGEQTVDITFENPYDYNINFDDGKFQISIKLMFENKEENKYFVNLSYNLKLLKANSIYTEKMKFTISDKIPKDKYNCQIVFNYIYPQYVSRKTKIEITK